MVGGAESRAHKTNSAARMRRAEASAPRVTDSDTQLREPDDLREIPGFAAPPRGGRALIGEMTDVGRQKT